MQDHDVVGIGNAIVDIIGRCDDAFLAKHDRTKGSMQLVDAPVISKLYFSAYPGKTFPGRCFKAVDPVSEGKAKFIAIDEQPNHQVVHLFRLRKANCTTH